MKLILYISKKYSIPIFKPLVEYLDMRNIEYRFYVSKKVKMDFPEDWDQSKIAGSRPEAKKFNPGFVLSSGNAVDFRIPGIKVQIFHGIGVEKPAHFKIRHFFNLYLTSGPFVTEKFKQLQKMHNYFEIRETGWLKIDYILKFDMNQFKPSFDIPEGKKIILYAPTHSNAMQSGSKMLESIEKLITEDEFWLIKFHEFMSKDLVVKFKEKNIKNIQIIDTYDITPYLHLADIMISDTSSVVYEFMCLNKPVITVNTISREDKGINISSTDELRPLIDKLKANPDLLKDNIKRHLEEVNPYLDGLIAERTVNELLKLKNENFIFKRKPLNLFRNLQIVYHGIKNKGYLK